MKDWEKWINESWQPEKGRFRHHPLFMQNFLSLLGNPHNSFQVIHVTGTNGKGSVSAVISEVLNQAGIKVGRYTSPHIHFPMERIWINGMDIAYETWVNTGDNVFALSRKLPEKPSPFEFLTAMGFLAFKEAKIEVAVIEAGIGGRLDATNVVNPIATVITSIGLDHCSLLGSTLEDIAFEKAGIIKEKCPVVCAPLIPNILNVIKKEAHKKNAPLIIAEPVTLMDTNNTDTIDNITNSKTSFIWKDKVWKTALNGEYQRFNLGTAFAVIEILRKQGFHINIITEAITKGLLNVNWPGRFEIIKNNPTVILDGAHNPDGMLALVSSLNKLKINGHRGMLLGFCKEKEASKMLSIAKKWATHIILTPFSSPRSMTKEELKNHLKNIDRTVSVLEIAFETVPETTVTKTIVKETVEDGLKEGLKRLGHDDCLVIAGSLFLVGEIRERFGNKCLERKVWK